MPFDLQTRIEQAFIVVKIEVSFFLLCVETIAHLTRVNYIRS